MIRLRRLLVWTLAPFVIYAGLALVGAIVPAPRVDVGPHSDDRWIILVRGPIHYDILLPLDDDTRAVFAFVEGGGVPLSNFNAVWLSVGWGSNAFYTTAGSYTDVSLGAVVRAATGDTGVMRFDVYGSLPDHPALRRIPVSAAQLDALRLSIRADLVESPSALPLPGFSQTDAFFPAAGRFNLLRTCNVWVGEMLSSAGLDFGMWTPTPYAVTLSLWWNGLVRD